MPRKGGARRRVAVGSGIKVSMPIKKILTAGWVGCLTLSHPGSVTQRELRSRTHLGRVDIEYVDVCLIIVVCVTNRAVTGPVNRLISYYRFG